MRHQIIRKYIVAIVFAAVIITGCEKAQYQTVGGYDFQYIVANKGKKPKQGEYVYYHVTSMAKGRVIKSSRTSQFPQVFEIPDEEKLMSYQSPFLEVLPEMSVGDSVNVVQSLEGMRRLPAEYGDAKELIYGVTLLSILSKEEYEADRQRQKNVSDGPKQLYKNKESKAEAIMTAFFSQSEEDRFDGFKSTESGIKFKLLFENEEGQIPEINRHMIDLSYYACLSDGKKLETSFKYGIPYTFLRGAGTVMPGWNEITGYLREGDEAIVYIPSEQAFGERAFKGNVEIPANEDLYFYMKIEELKDIKN